MIPLPGTLLGFGMLFGGWAPAAAQITATINITAPPPPSTPWDPTGWRGRVAVREYTTGFFCGVCYAHTRAFEALLKRYPRTVFVPLAYHGTINFPMGIPVDSLWERYWGWYGVLYPDARPFLKPGAQGFVPEPASWRPPVASAAAQGDAAATEYARYAAGLDAELQQAPEAVLQVQAVPRGGSVITTVRVDSIRGRHAALYLRLALVQDTVTVLGPPDKQGKIRTQWYMVVRAAAHTKALPLGLPLPGPGATHYTFDVAAVQRRLWADHALGKGVSSAAPIPQDSVGELKWFSAQFPDARDWRIDPAHLHVVAFVQDATTGEILQAQMVKVEQPGGAKLVLPAP